MRKIPTIFVRDWAGDPGRVTPIPAPECGWVFAGEGVATRKYDGTACLVEGGRLYRRETVRDGKPRPEGFILAEHEDGRDGNPGKDVGWSPVGDGPEDRWHREAFAAEPHLADGTYELLGPKVQRNPERFAAHVLLRHTDAEAMLGIVRTYDGIRETLALHDVEGIVFQHPDGRMAKIKKRDFGLAR